jgi:leucyl aminopeptidase
MPSNLTKRGGAGTVPISCVTKSAFKAWLAAQPPEVQGWIEAVGFDAAPGKLALLPGKHGEFARAVFGHDAQEALWSYAALAAKLPAGRYSLADELDGEEAERAALGWGLAGYAFERYRSGQGKKKQKAAQLVWPKHARRERVEAFLAAAELTRDLINTPANDMGPAELAGAARELARKHKAKLTVIEGEGLEKKGFPAIYAVGKGSARAPRLIDLTWGRKGPLVALVGKGVCFDSGGLDLKPSSGMLLMKKDMGGAAHVLGLASYIMERKLPVRLRVLIPAVENFVSGTSYRPLDVIGTRKGLSVEVGNTDAEGRIVLADALTEASAGKPDAIFDFATLTGAARVALGPELPALFCNDEDLAARILAASQAEGDPLWRLPLHQPYRRLIDGKVADLNNVSSDSYAGAIIAGLFLQNFVGEGLAWAHLDIMAWNARARPGRPQGAEMMGLRAVAAVIEELAAEPKRRRGAKGGKA